MKATTDHALTDHDLDIVIGGTTFLIPRYAMSSSFMSNYSLGGAAAITLVKPKAPGHI